MLLLFIRIVTNNTKSMIRIFFLCVNHNIILDLYPMIIFLKELNLKQWEKSHGIILLTTCHNFAVSSTSQNEYHLTNFPQWGQPCGLIMVSNLTWLDISLVTKAKIQIYFEIALKINWLLILQPVNYHHSDKVIGLQVRDCHP